MFEIPASVSDAIFVLVLVLPGYYSLRLFRWLAYYEEEITNTDVLVGSLTFSLVIYIIAGIFCGLSTFDEIRDLLLNPWNVGVVIVIIFGTGTLPGLGMRWVKTGKNEIFITVWDAMMDKSLGTGKATWVIVYTNDGKEYKGYIHRFGHKKEKKDLTLKLPIRIVRNDDSTVREEFQVGDEVYFNESDINRIVFLKEVNNEV